MSLLAIPNVSEGRDPAVVDALVVAAGSAGAHVLDVHTDPVHNRSVLTMSGNEEQLPRSLMALATTARQRIDLTLHEGAHPRLGVLDVCPLVPHGESMTRPRGAALHTAELLGAAGFPVYLYGASALSPGTRELPDIRKGGLAAVIERANERPPDLGPRVIDPRTGVVCVGARPTLIAFNVWIACDVRLAREIARDIRGRDGIRALGIRIDEGSSQVSMNLTRPDSCDVEGAFERVRSRAVDHGAQVIATEVVGLVPQRYLPNPDAEAARLLIAPGRSLESVLTL
jgi:glutamate formiminotransferase